ncbi:RNA-binding cell elongation regulator Jag/EloR [Citroniella saccharovorans]|uniref:RNA-binding protein KhpB n=1 Tax=Citroniella saccharovorans TaxID=2053367 RepID=A0AAW9MVZ6_9FIRM|nr:RNA-binding cell elongation regulator Jag/EloR [Citroniella saccharovorans]MEB3428684.1 RNA-binding cell elongation regulator Jag/EloR [Citroniella saccharovorans]
MRQVVRTGKTIDDAVNSCLKVLQVDKDKVQIEVIEEPKTGLFGIIGSKDAIVRVSVKEEKEDILSSSLFNDGPSEGEKVEETTSREFKEESEEETNNIENDLNSSLEESTHEQFLSEEDKNEEFIEKEEDENEDEDFSDIDEEESVVSVSEEELLEKAKISQELLGDILSNMKIESSIEYNIVKERNIIEFNINAFDDRDTSIVIGRRGETLDAINYILNLVSNKNFENYTRVVLDIANYRKKREDQLIKLAQNKAFKVKKYKKNIRLEPMNPYERRIVHTALQSFEGVTTVSEGQEPYRKVVIKYIKNM